MKSLITNFCFVFLVYSDSIAISHKEEALHPAPIQLQNVHHYESVQRPGLVYPLQAATYEVETDGNRKYIIGLFSTGFLFPFVVPRAGLQNGYEKVKIRIDGDYAHDLVPIDDNDPLNSLFGERFSPQNIHLADIE